MSEHGDKSFDTGKLLITLTPPGTRSSFDQKKFQSEHEDLYQSYLKTSKTKESLRITLR